MLDKVKFAQADIAIRPRDNGSELVVVKGYLFDDNYGVRIAVAKWMSSWYLFDISTGLCLTTESKSKSRRKCVSKYLANYEWEQQYFSVRCTDFYLQKTIEYRKLREVYGL